MLLNVKYLQILMKKKGWSERQLAMKSGLSSATVSRIISGKRGAGTRALVGIRQAFPDEPLEKLFFLSN
ncbi:helix-turn-helix transcriptional regulator [Clostridium sp.]|jgi:transcriptional regulator with XRE-family HTH domain|uniref:helix-turn-helix domain-containing protein n=1 Tax=Clostridium sp. TaxID=1506 RepID=UPI00284DFE4D|nr:helix-turn-helix transcriptional regulator [Clostridium sp.]MDR3597046.1 helix-turn-helix transcriptional regulator [Clostridium sp.]